MLDQSTRAAILKLKQQGHSIRGIARALQVSRGAVRDVLRSGTEIVRTLVREEAQGTGRGVSLWSGPRDAA